MKSQGQAADRKGRRPGTLLSLRKHENISRYGCRMMARGKGRKRRVDNTAAVPPLPQEPFRLFLFHRLCQRLFARPLQLRNAEKIPAGREELSGPIGRTGRKRKTRQAPGPLRRRHGSPQTAGLIRKRRLEGLIAVRLLSGFLRVPSCPEGSLYGGLTAPIGLSSGFLRSAKPNHTRFLLPRSIRISGGSG